MLDAYARVFPVKDLNFTIGQMRVPFTIDAHRSPHQQYFANRSFIAKQVGNVRDVGLTSAYTHKGDFPFILEGGLFNRFDKPERMAQNTELFYKGAVTARQELECDT